MAQISTAKDIKELASGEVVLAEGQRNECFFVVLSGSIDISQNGRSIRTLAEGDVFGLEARFFDRPSSVQARAAEKSRVAVYEHGLLTDIIYGRPQMAERIVASLLQQLEQTTQVARERLGRINAISVNMRFLEDGEVIIREGEAGSEIYKLVSTERGLRVTLGGQELGIITQPEFIFGEMGGILGVGRSATVTSLGRSVVQVYPREHLQEFIEENPAFARQLIEHLAARLAKNPPAGAKKTH